MSKYVSFQGIEEVKIPMYEVIDADSVDDAFPPRPFKVPARSRASDPWAIDVEDAACQWAEEVWPYHDYPDSLAAIVTDPDGVKWRVDITVEAVPSFTGRAKRVDP
ncbi:MAG: hypothetical protein KGS10_04435 [Chloroflexi bacterium]|nr:hypothetical protein [Chloroflexota bacterium]